MPLDPQLQAMRDQREREGAAPLYAMSLADARKEAKKLLTEEPVKHSGMTFAAAYDGDPEIKAFHRGGKARAALLRAGVFGARHRNGCQNMQIFHDR